MKKNNNSLASNKILVIVIFLLLLTNIAKADRRYFGNLYLAYTPAARELELELWQTSRIGKTNGSFFSWQPQVEVEYSFTDKFVSSFYVNFISQKSSDNNFESKPLSISSVSVELRYRLAEQDEFFVDPALYFEFIYGNGKVEYEPKLLLSKRFGRFISGINIGSAFEKDEDDTEMEAEFEISLGLAYDLTNNFAMGIEFKNNRTFESFYGKEKNQAAYIGPTFGYGAEDINFVLSFLAQIKGSPSSNKNLDLISHEKYELRFLASIEL